MKKQKIPIVLEIAVLRYRGLTGTETLSLQNLITLSSKSLEETFENHLYLYEAWNWEPDLFKTDDRFIKLVSDKSHIANWPVVSYDLVFQKKQSRKQSNSCTRGLFTSSFPRQMCSVRVHVASDLPVDNRVKESAVKFCLANEIIVVNNLFSFAQSDFDYMSCAELDILDVVKSHFLLYNHQPIANAIFSTTL